MAKFRGKKPGLGARALRAFRPVNRRRVARGVWNAGAAVLNNAWSLDSVFNLSDRIVDKVSGWTVPSFVGSVTVSVKGGPHADIKRVWYLACAAAFGRTRNTYGGGDRRDTFVTHELAGMWDVTGKVCQIEIAYSTAIIDNLVAPAKAPGGPGPGVRAMVNGVAIIAAVNPTRRPMNYVKRGPEQLTVGGVWPDWMRRRPLAFDPNVSTWRGAACGAAGPGIGTLRTVTAVPKNYADVFREYPVVNGDAFGFYPFTLTQPPGLNALFGVQLGAEGEFTLPDSNRVITTAHKDNPRVQPPGPPLDGRSRSNLLGLIAQTLQSPCFLPTQPACTAVPNGDAGVYVPGPGGGIDRSVDFSAVGLGRFLTRNTNAVDTLPGAGADGTPASLATASAVTDFR